MPRNNILLMLSTQEPPHPRDEVKWHDANCKETGHTYVITTRDLAGEEYETVAFFGDASLGNQVLATAHFEKFISVVGPEGAGIGAEHGLYRNGNAPRRSKGFIEVKDFQLAPENADLRSLKGELTDGSELTVANLPGNQHRVEVIYRSRQS